jgi:aspartyl-tRNA synthetase
MRRTLIRNLDGEMGKVKVAGFVEKVRDQKKRQFVILRDISGKIQLINEKEEKNADITEKISSLTAESAVSFVGTVVSNPAVHLGGVEIQIEKIEIESLADSPLPITSDSSLERRLDWRNLSLRYPEQTLVFQIQTAMEKAMRKFWWEEGFIEIHSPKLMGTASESGAELFSLPYFDKKTAFLAQSPQFYKQMAIAGGLEKVFEIGPVFRANPSFTSRHDTEFTSLDMEVAWIDGHEDIMELEEKWLVYMLSCIESEYGEAIKEVFGVKVTVPSIPFPRLSLKTARSLLAREGHIIDHKADMDPEGERKLSELIFRDYGHEFVFVTEYPESVRPFYHMRYPGSDVTKSFDLLWRGLEITTGAQREHRLNVLKRQALEKGLSPGPLEHYFDSFRYGCPPHGGCGIGLTRLLMILLGRQNVREVTFLYRGPNRLVP